MVDAVEPRDQGEHEGHDVLLRLLLLLLEGLPEGLPEGLLRLRLALLFLLHLKELASRTRLLLHLEELASRTRFTSLAGWMSVVGRVAGRGHTSNTKCFFCRAVR